MRSTVGDIDFLASAADSAAVMQAFTGLPDVARVVGQGETKASLEFSHNLRAQLWVHPPERFGTALQYATGSKDHNVRLRELALKRGLSLSDQAFLRADGSELCAPRKKKSTPRWDCPGYRPSCAKIAAKSRQRWRVSCPSWCR